MTHASDRDYLYQQYSDATNLDARIALHQRYSTHPQGWHEWVYDQFDLPPDARILELGCGPGHLWRSNLERLPEGWRIVLSDLSRGMVREARRNLRIVDHTGERWFSFTAHGAGTLPYPDHSFDAVVANHMLYHVPDKWRALSEIYRVLVPGGRFYAATNGKDHMRELRALSRRVQPEADRQIGSVAASFSLENGSFWLWPWFPRLTCVRQENALRVPEVGPVLAYLASTQALSEEAMGQCAVLLGRELGEKGVIEIAKDAGLFVGIRG
jgi:ubiquinone/menaquinone biosynthesis C-methylase UbiE